MAKNTYIETIIDFFNNLYYLQVMQKVSFFTLLVIGFRISVNYMSSWIFGDDKEIKEQQEEIDRLEKEINDIEGEVDELEDEVERLKKEKDGIDS